MPTDRIPPDDRMPESPRSASCRRALDLIDRLPDDDLSPLERSFLARHVTGCPECAAEQAAAWTLAGAFSELAEERCPPEVVRRVLARAEEEAGAGGGGREAPRRHGGPRAPLPETAPARLSRGRSTPGRSTAGRSTAGRSKGGPARAPWRPLLAAAALAALVGASVVTSQLWRSPPTAVRSAAEAPGPTFTVAEREQAEAELELVFSYLARIGTDTGDILGDQLEQHVVRTTQRALLGGSGSSGGSKP